MANAIPICKTSTCSLINCKSFIYLSDCGANCHKQCKDLLVLACRKLSRGTSIGSSHGSLPSSPSLAPGIAWNIKYVVKSLTDGKPVELTVTPCGQVCKHTSLKKQTFLLGGGYLQPKSGEMPRVTSLFLHICYIVSEHCTLRAGVTGRITRWTGKKKHEKRKKRKPMQPSRLKNGKL